MAGSLRCPQCGLVQISRPQCKRCGTGLGERAPFPRAAPAPLSNPYAPPGADPSSGRSDSSADALWREGRILVMRPSAVLPDRCIKCNAPAVGYRLKRVLYWHRPAWYLLIVLSIFIYALVALIVRRRAMVEVGLCPRHRRQRYLALAFGVVALFGGMGGCIALGAESEAALYLGLLLALTGFLVVGIANQVVRAAEIDEHYVKLRGAGADFLAFLPDFGSGLFR